MYSFGTDEYAERIISTYSSALLRAAYTVLHSTADAEDAVQETFIRLMTKRPSFSDAGHERAWLLRVVINTAKDMRKKAAARVVPLDEAPEPVDESSSGAGETSDVLDAVLALPERYSTVIHLYYYEGCSIREIAGILGVPAATVGTRLARARALLRNSLKGEYGNELQ